MNLSVALHRSLLRSFESACTTIYLTKGLEGMAKGECINKTSHRFAPAIRSRASKDPENNLLSTYNNTIRNEKDDVDSGIRKRHWESKKSTHRKCFEILVIR
jgi:hypothetical protein